MSLKALFPVTQQFQAKNGSNLVGGRVYIYYQGRTALATTYHDEEGTVVNSNPVLLDNNGRATVFANTIYAYTIVVCDYYGKELFSQDITLHDAISTAEDVKVIGSDGSVKVDTTTLPNGVQYDMSVNTNIIATKESVDEVKTDLNTLTGTVNNHTTQIEQIQEDISGGVGGKTYTGIAPVNVDNDNNTIAVDIMQGASSSNDGKSGIVPKPLSGQEYKFLRADGTWAMAPNQIIVEDDIKLSVEILNSANDLISYDLLSKVANTIKLSPSIAVTGTLRSLKDGVNNTLIYSQNGTLDYIYPSGMVSHKAVRNMIDGISFKGIYYASCTVESTSYVEIYSSSDNSAANLTYSTRISKESTNNALCTFLEYNDNLYLFMYNRNVLAIHKYNNYNNWERIYTLTDVANNDFEFGYPVLTKSNEVIVASRHKLFVLNSYLNGISKVFDLPTSSIAYDFVMGSYTYNDNCYIVFNSKACIKYDGNNIELITVPFTESSSVIKNVIQYDNTIYFITTNNDTLAEIVEYDIEANITNVIYTTHTYLRFWRFAVNKSKVNAFPQVQPDWNDNNANSPAYINNKPDFDWKDISSSITKKIPGGTYRVMYNEAIKTVSIDFQVNDYYVINDNAYEVLTIDNDLYKPKFPNIACSGYTVESRTTDNKVFRSYIEDTGSMQIRFNEVNIYVNLILHVMYFVG